MGLLEGRFHFLTLDFAFPGHEFQRVFLVLRESHESFVVANATWVTRFEGLVMLSLGWHSPNDVAMFDISLNVKHNMWLVKETIVERAHFVREVLLLEFGQVVVKLLTSQLFGCIVVIVQVFGHAAEGSLFLGAVSNLGLAGDNISWGDHHFTIFIAVVLLDLLVVGKMVEGCVVTQTHLLGRTEGPVMLGNGRQLLTLAEMVLATVLVRLT